MNFMLAFIISNIEMGKVCFCEKFFHFSHLARFGAGEWFEVSKVCNEKTETCSILKQAKKEMEAKESIAAKKEEKKLFSLIRESDLGTFWLIVMLFVDQKIVLRTHCWNF